MMVIKLNPLATLAGLAALAASLASSRVHMPHYATTDPHHHPAQGRVAK
jgi:hypothetical protein